MQRRRSLAIPACLVLFTLAATGAVIAQDDPPAPEPVTVSDPAIPTEELALLLKPLTKDQLLVEAEAWRALVQAKAEEIAAAEIAVQRQNREIEAAKEIEKQAEAASEAMAEVKAQAEKAQAGGDADAMAEAGAAAEKARANMDEVQAQVDQAREAAADTAEAEAALDVDMEASAASEEEVETTADAADAAAAAVEEASERVEEATSVSGDVVRAAAEQVSAAAGAAEQATGTLAEDAAAAAEANMAGAAEVMAGASEEKKTEKVALLEKVAELREERTVLLDQLKTVIAALEVKTDEGDTATLATIKDLRLYAGAVSGITVDVKDTTSAWLAIKGWFASEEGGIRWAINLAKFVGILIAAWIIAGIFSGLIHRAMKRLPGTSRLLEDFLVKAARWIVLAVGIIMALAALELSIGPLLAVVGAAGFVIAFALQDSLGNFASGLMILFFRPFDVGDVVDAGGVSGTVDSMNLVSTTIKTFDNKRMVVPNNKVWGDVITNASGVSERRVDMEFGIGYDDDIDKAQGILEEIIGSHPLVLEEPAPTIKMAALADSSVNFIARPWAKTGDYWQVFWDVTREVKKRFDAEGIGIPFPQRDVHLYLEGEGGQALIRQFAAPRGGAGDAEPAPKDTAPRRDGGLDD